MCQQEKNKGLTKIEELNKLKKLADRLKRKREEYYKFLDRESKRLHDKFGVKK